MKVKQLRFDAWCLRAVVLELQSLIGRECQNAESLGEQGVALQFWQGRGVWLHIRTHPESYGMRLGDPPPRRDRTAWVQALRRELNRSTLVAVEQYGLERVAHLIFDQSGSKAILTVELMGKNSNILLRDPLDRVVVAAKWVGKAKSGRPILPGRAFEPYPASPALSVLEGGEGGVSPFVSRLLADYDRAAVLARLREVGPGATLVPGYGVTPINMNSDTLRELFGDQTVPKRFDSVSAALAAWEEQRPEPEMQVLRHRLETQLRRVEQARAHTLANLDLAADTARRASELQEQGNLILSYQSMVQPGAKQVQVWDNHGAELVISLNPDITPVENAESYFARAKKAKHGESEVNDQRDRVRQELTTVRSLMVMLAQSKTDAELEEIKLEAEKRDWLHSQAPPAKDKKERPFEGHAIKELIGPQGYAVFYGENSEANDYLTMRMGKPNDWWLHVRGAPSAHILIRTNNQPDKVPRETLEFAAILAARHSPNKHSQFVPVDYTLKKYVRRPKGSKPGFVTYTHEKTLHVDPKHKN